MSRHEGKKLSLLSLKNRDFPFEVNSVHNILCLFQGLNLLNCIYFRPTLAILMFWLVFFFSSVSLRLLRCRLNLKVNALIVGKVPIIIFVLHLPV